MQKILFLLLFFLLFSCAEKLMDKPENLIAKEKMILILNDLAIVNAAKVNGIKVLQDNDIDPTAYIFEKYSIDSLQFVESDRYYASIPELHEEIYIAVEAKLEAENERITTIKKIKDSLKAEEKRAVITNSDTTNAPQKNGGRKR